MREENEENENKSEDHTITNVTTAQHIGTSILGRTGCC